MRSTVAYVYCILASPIPHALPAGIDDVCTKVITLPGRESLHALVASLDAGEYAADAVSDRLTDSAWLAPRAMAHDSVVTWAADHGAVIPFRMWVMFSDDDAVRSMMHDRADEFTSAIEAVSGAREFGVRVFGERAALEAAAETMDLDLARLERQAAEATPGQAYLIRRKLAEGRKAAARDVAARISDDAHARLAELSRVSQQRATALANDPGVILDGAYLVEDDRYESFRSLLTAIMAEYGPYGIRFDFTGPWPPYHFVRGS